MWSATYMQGIKLSEGTLVLNLPGNLSLLAACWAPGWCCAGWLQEHWFRRKVTFAIFYSFWYSQPRTPLLALKTHPRKQIPLVWDNWCAVHWVRCIHLHCTGHITVIVVCPSGSARQTPVWSLKTLLSGKMLAVSMTWALRRGRDSAMNLRTHLLLVLFLAGFAGGFML